MIKFLDWIFATPDKPFKHKWYHRCRVPNGGGLFHSWEILTRGYVGRRSRCRYCSLGALSAD